MKTGIAILLAGAAFLLSCPAKGNGPAFRSAADKALFLYDNGMYDRARTVFEEAGDPLSKAYAVLCAVRTEAPGYETLVAGYESRNPKSVLLSEIHFRYAANLFRRGAYAEAEEQYSLVDEKRLDESSRVELRFKRGYCAYEAGAYNIASEWFRSVISLPVSAYTAPSNYYLGYISYSRRNFKAAESYFLKSSNDSRIGELSRFYLLECRFMAGDYDYVTANAERELDTAPSERKSRISRMLSESYLVRGNRQKAKQFYEMENSAAPKTRSDYFHAGSVLYSVDDFAGAIRNFSDMTDRTDSIGQIANYQLGYSYIRRNNKVKALEAFNDAAKYDFNPEITEDAAFNYAKLAFDLNNDQSAFKAYMERYSTSRKGEQIYDYMALACLVNRDYSGAIENYGRIDELGPRQKANYVKANYLRGCQLSEAGAWTAAIPYFKSAGFHFGKNDGFNQLARYGHAEALYHTGKFNQSQVYFTELYNASALYGTPQGRILPYNIGYCCFSSGNYANAARWFDKYIDSGEQLARKDAMERRADCDFLRADYRSAALLYERLRAEYPSPDYLYPLYREAMCLSLKGDLKGKLSLLSKSVQVPAGMPWRDESVYELGRTYLEMADYDSAESTFRLLRSSTSDSSFVARSLVGLGTAKRNVKAYDEALSYYKQVVRLMPDSEYSRDAALAIESIYQSKNEPQKYLEWVEEEKIGTTMTAEDRQRLFFTTGERLYLAGSHASAVPALLKYVDTYPSGASAPEAWFYLADSYKALGEKEKACDAYARSLSMLPPDSSFSESALLSLARLSYELERYRKAYDYYTDLLGSARFESNRAEARTGRMRSAYMAKDYESAISASLECEGPEADYYRAKSLLNCSRRDEAMELFRKLALKPATPEGAESEYIIIQDCLDRGDYETLEKRVYAFSGAAGSQSYYLAKVYLLLGDSFLQRGNAAQAKATYESIRDGYSGNDDIRENVESRLQKLSNEN